MSLRSASEGTDELSIDQSATSLLQGSSENEAQFSSNKHPYIRRALGTVALLCLFPISVVVIYGIFQYQGKQLVPKSRTFTCGNTTVDAQQNNCVYDPLAVSWVPRQCLDSKSLQEYNDHGPWEYFQNKNRSGKIDPLDLGFEMYYTTIREHVVHCAIVWQRLHRFTTGSHKNLVFTSSLSESKLEHTEHCSRMLIKWVDNFNATKLHELGTRNNPGFQTCSIVEK
ncbi:hypothetical protein BCIN_03g00020 [Botrytis cinerea B05.10]|uniref:Major facilitator superfamily transporter protein n=1 Tax=Botryotinia fuckeliana (strain B05.10) TaxID=332648 RepID=A0A384JAR7_BOTFB|nr:hypothetical protein BCIN_03g00020 [Botrytis cinerea B05.10]ATZ47689.1 hypothetical protein BCIN_03g00020 [Botrytis cinerea B05.10]